MRQVAGEVRHERKQEKVQMAGLSQGTVNVTKIGTYMQVCHYL